MEQLIELVRQREVLYNSSASDYRDQNVRQHAWNEIGRQLKIDGKTAKKKWEKLRRCFINAKNRRLSKKSAKASSKLTVPWKYELQMSFIMPYVGERKPYGHWNDYPTVQNVEMEEQEVDAFESDEEKKYTPTEDLTAMNMQEEYIQVQEWPRNVSPPCQEVAIRLQMGEDEQHQEAGHKDRPAIEMVLENTSAVDTEYDEEEEQIQSKMQSLLENLDDTDLFFLSMSRMTKQLPKLEQANIKLMLSKKVLEAEVRNCQKRKNNQSQEPQYRTDTRDLSEKT